MPLDPLEQRFVDAGLPAGTLRRWFDRLLRDGFALAASGGYRSFGELAVGALRNLDGHRLPSEAAQELTGAITELPPRPDAVPAIRDARAHDVRVVALTNGSASTTRSLLERAGLTPDVELVVSADEVCRWKPAPEPYLHAAKVCGVAPGRLALVAAHGWDVQGARRAGLVTGWSGHLEGRFPDAFEPADVTGTDLVSVVARLVAS